MPKNQSGAARARPRVPRGDIRFHRVAFPNDLEVDDVLDFVRALAFRRRRGLFLATSPVIFEVRTIGNDVEHWLGLARSVESAVLAQLHVHLPNVRVDESVERVELKPDRVWELRLRSARRSLRTDNPEQISAALLASLQEHPANESVTLQWIIGPWLPRPIVKPTAATAQSSWSDFIVSGSHVASDGEEAAALRKKQAEPLFGVTARIAVSAETPVRQRRLLHDVLGALQLARQPGVGLIRRHLLPAVVRRRYVSRYLPAIDWPCVLNAAELVSVIGWPIGHPVVAGLRYGGGRQLPPTRELLISDSHFDAMSHARRSRVRVVGRSTYPGRTGRVMQSPRAALQHTLVVGPTGSGKSELLTGLILADIAAGRGVVAIDPKAGDLVDAIVDRLPADRLEDVVVFDVAERDRPIGVNVIAGNRPELVVDQVVHIFTELYGADGLGPRSRDILHSGLLTLARAGGYTICELPALLTNAGFRRRLTGGIDDPLGLSPFWNWYSALGDAERATVIAPLMNKLRPFVLRFPNVLGQAEPHFSMLDVFTKRRVVLVSLAKGLVGPQAAQLLGALIVNQLWNATLSRASIPAERRHPVMVYLDEFADIVRLPTSLGDMLAQARGLGVGITLAAQHVHQLPPAMRADALANARSKIVFQLGSDDAAVFAKQLGGGLQATDIQSLPRFEIYAGLVHEQAALPPASAITLPLPPSLGLGHKVREHSRQAFGQDASDVQRDLRSRLGHVDAPEGPVGRARRSS